MLAQCMICSDLLAPHHWAQRFFRQWMRWLLPHQSNVLLFYILTVLLLGQYKYYHILATWREPLQGGCSFSEFMEINSLLF